MTGEAHERLMRLLDGAGARYRLIEHEPEGRTAYVSALRGHHPRQAAKCLVLMVKEGKKVTRFALAVVPGDARVDIEAVKRLMSGTYAGFASTPDAERITGCVAGTMLPFSFNEELPLFADPGIREHPEIFFNAGRLDRSLALDTADYIRIANPRFEKISL